MTDRVSTDISPPAEPDIGSPPPTSRQVWIAGFLLLFGMLAAWSVATPTFAAPDEPAHAYRAASLAHGELLGLDVSKPGNPSLQVRVPTVLTSYGPTCFAFRSWVPASCMTFKARPPGTVPVTTYTGRYPPLYYLAVGLPSLLPLGGSMVIWMRLAGDVVNALFLTVAFVLLTGRRRSWWAMAGGAVAMTPLALFMGSVLNPSGLEIASAMALWCALLNWATVPAGVPARSTVVWAAVSAVVFESTRGLSTAFMLFTVAACALVAGWPRIRSVAGRHDVRVAGAVVAVFGVAALSWVLVAGSLRLLRTAPVPPGRSTGSIIRLVVHRSAQFPGFVGKFGWQDTASPLWVVQVWQVAALALVVGVVLSRAWRVLAVLGLVLAATIVIPAAGDLLEARTIGIVSQPRYILPLAIGSALVAGSGIRWRGGWSRTTAQLLVAAVAVAQVGAFVHTLQRYRTGIGPKVDPALPVWSPPLGSVAVTGLFILAVVGFLGWLWRRGRAGDRTDVQHSAAPAPLAGAGQLE